MQGQLNVAQTAMDWVIDGFNANVILTGQSGTGKSAMLLNEDLQSHSPLLLSMLEHLFASPRLQASAEVKVSMACWELKQHQTVDLFQDCLPTQVS